MKIMVITKNERLHFFTAYAPQTGCSEQVKEEFWTLLHEKTAEIPQEEMNVVAGDLYGHVGARKDGDKCSVSKTTMAVVLDTEHGTKMASAFSSMHARTTLSSRTRHSIDYVLVRRRDAKFVSDAKVVLYETVATQHRPLICTMKFTPPKQMRDERCGHERIKWWCLKKKEAEVIGGIRMPPIVDVDGTWQDMKSVVYDAARSQLGVTKPGRRMIDRQTWLSTEEVKEKVRAKKRLHNVFLCNKTVANWSAYQETRRAAKKAVVIAKAAHHDEVNRRLETRDGERLIYKLARTRQRQSEDVEKFHGVNDEHDQLVMDTKKVMERWRYYFEKISTDEFPHPPLPHAEPILGPILSISAEEVVLALRKMKLGKVTGPSDVAAEL
ncbi:hypothetical protein Q1695_011868 [Nippostrongylus brasiliensis]|nr:hypothetical protein Q1695_011868 [Nippostrongylus brasiliensis]